MTFIKLSTTVAKYVLALLMVSSLLACVSETVSTTKRQVDKQKALELHVKLAQGYVSKGNRESARLHLGKAFDINKRSPEATLVLAQLYELEGEPALAEETFKKAIRLKKDFTEAHNSYGISLFNAKRYEEALSQFERAAADLGYDGRAEALVNVGRTAVQLGKKQRAHAAFEHATVLNRDLPPAFIELADLNFQEQNYAEAKQNLDRFMALTSATPRALLIGIRLERIFGNKDKEASYLLMLKNKFPYSREYLEYKDTLAH
ncbi:type IV pilus biogenesis/stability protein PilW [Cellvibrio japonicus]|uniref:Type IV pilus biogenesis protein PilF n=1 Tax=Cellvibrio japonicus (strain Ueda107) TaxID=498211 RepID=B3PDL9_CELJU|nr:type IV pilus biogenesis/stability protein PilW [Cellvibrio japonicus]ACE85508.1 type IV pilus biogenesis protein PilF [Cellvibrio japonicus Ueda107]QEI12030.1 type IV pilus biogenesis/stability protein PilW [Cellvibrio japonicus]QEI15605.1 type IV pilus biogenesis/stability protein PilW [Cellvibrio japonicus]QEI19183.1 type IV pilus biogenesis/stability protein PilW [Cellvibrio japonicus]